MVDVSGETKSEPAYVGGGAVAQMGPGSRLGFKRGQAPQVNRASNPVLEISVSLARAPYCCEGLSGRTSREEMRIETGNR